MKKGTLYGIISIVFFAGFLGLVFMSGQSDDTTSAFVEQAAISTPATEPAAGDAAPAAMAEEEMPPEEMPPEDMPADAAMESAPASEPAEVAASEAAVAETATVPAPEQPVAQEAAVTAAETAAAAVPAETPMADVPVLPDVIVTLALGERSMGDINAPVSVIEYASMTCSHCAHFHNTILADLKKQYIDTGKIHLTMRDFPLDNMALKAAMMARCAPKENYFNLVEVIFANQQRWLASDDQLGALKKLGRLAGLTDEAFDSCMKNKDIETELLKRMQEGQSQWDIKSTPTFIFNSGQVQFSGAEDFAKFQKTIDAILLKEKKGQ